MVAGTLAVSLLAPELPVFNSSVRVCLLLALAAIPVTAQPPGQKEVRQEKKDTLPALPVVAADASPLRKAQLELVREGLDYITRCKDLIQAGTWVVGDFRRYSDVLTATCQTASELEEKATNRVPWYEFRVRRLKEVEGLVDRGVRVGGIAPQELNLIRFQRLQAEVDLLKLKAEIEKASGK